MDKLKEAFEAIEKQQGMLRNDIWMVGEQLKEMLGRDPAFAEDILEDLKNPGQSLEECAKRIRTLARKNRAKDFGCVTPAEAEGILREVYGWSAEKTGAVVDDEARAIPGGRILSLDEFF